MQGVVTLENCTISGNQSDRYGGGLLNDSGTMTLTFCTVGNNGAAEGGGIYITGVTTTDVRYTIVANSPAGQDCVNQGSAIAQSYAWIADGTCGAGLSGDPLLGPLQDNRGFTATHAPQPGSPAIDRIPIGNDTGCGTTITTDQTGMSRPQGAGCDLGAFESQP